MAREAVLAGRIQVQLTPSLWDWVWARAKAQEMSMSAMVRLLLAECKKREEQEAA